MSLQCLQGSHCPISQWHYIINSILCLYIVSYMHPFSKYKFYQISLCYCYNLICCRFTAVLVDSPSVSGWSEVGEEVSQNVTDFIEHGANIIWWVICHCLNPWATLTPVTIHLSPCEAGSSESPFRNTSLPAKYSQTTSLPDKYSVVRYWLSSWWFEKGKTGSSSAESVLIWPFLYYIGCYTISIFK